MSIRSLIFSIIILTTFGYSQWAIGLGGTSLDDGRGIAVDGTGNSYITVFFQGTADFDPSANSFNLTSAGSSDIFVAKFAADGALPVELGYFKTNNSLEGVLCAWRTESEIENLGFLLERRTDGLEWTEIVSYKIDNTLIGQGTTSAPTEYEYLDKLVEQNTTYEYRLADVDYDGVVTYHSVRSVTVENAPLSAELEEFIVMPAYPNPFNPSTTLTFGLDKDSKVTINIYDITGQLVNTLYQNEQKQGWHSIEWKGTDQNKNQVPTGIYLGRITSNEQTKTVKLMLLK